MIPPRRGAQKKKALQRRQEQQEEDEQQQQTPEQPAAATKLQNRNLPGHEDLGLLKLIFAKSKSYLTCTTPQPGQPALLCQLTESQVGKMHGPLLLCIGEKASQLSLSREKIKMLRDAVLEEHKQRSATKRASNRSPPSHMLAHT